MDKFYKDELISTEELVNLTHLSKRFWESRRISGDTPPYIRISRRCVRYRWRDVEEWLENKKVKNTSDLGD